MLEDKVIQTIKASTGIAEGWVKENGVEGITSEYDRYFYIVPLGDKTATPKGAMLEVTESYSLVIGSNTSDINTKALLLSLNKARLKTQGVFSENTESIYLEETTQALREASIKLVKVVVVFTDYITECNECIFDRDC